MLIPLKAMLTLPAEQMNNCRNVFGSHIKKQGWERQAGQYHQRSDPNLPSKQNREAPQMQVSTTTSRKTYCTVQ